MSKIIQIADYRPSGATEPLTEERLDQLDNRLVELRRIVEHLVKANRGVRSLLLVAESQKNGAMLDGIEECSDAFQGCINVIYASISAIGRELGRKEATLIH